jgi:D-galactarolactone cycloisomerase
VAKEPIVQKDGWVAIPGGPGLGIEIDRSALARFKVA